MIHERDQIMYSFMAHDPDFLIKMEDALINEMLTGEKSLIQTTLDCEVCRKKWIEGLHD